MLEVHQSNRMEEKQSPDKHRLRDIFGTGKKELISVPERNTEDMVKGE